jgi:dTDP-3-amino-3,4,6-trideoxy-alpha-D-glucose transaminase
MTVPYLDLAVEARALETDLTAAAQRVIRSGRYILGDEVERFEAEFAAAVGSRHCVGVGNGLDALALTLRAWGVGPGDEVVVPANTYIATWLAVSAVGAVPVPVDPDPETLTIGGAGISPRITDRTAAVVAVHLYGFPCDVAGIRRSLGGRPVRILEDAAQAHGATRDGRTVGALGDGAAFSFYPSKNLGALGDGGAVTTDDDVLEAAVRLLHNYGSRAKGHHEVAGTNSRLDEIQAAFLRVKLTHLEEWNRRRSVLAGAYLEQLGDIPALTLPSRPPAGATHVWHVFNVHHPRRDELRDALAGRGIGTQLYYPEPPHLSPAYAPLGYSAGDFPVTEHSAATGLALPLSPYLTPEQQDQVVTAVREAAAELA